MGQQGVWMADDSPLAQWTNDSGMLILCPDLDPLNILQYSGERCYNNGSDNIRIPIIERNALSFKGFHSS